MMKTLLLGGTRKDFLKTLCIGAFVMIGLACHAQSWCPPGARWVYNSSDPTLGASYNSFTYAGDTVVDGFTAQRIVQYGVITQIWGSDTLIGTSGPDILTRTEPGIVFWWLANLQEWDTLYWFGAAVGDRWSPGWQQGTQVWPGVCDEGTYLTVLGTGSTEVDGVALGTLAMGVMHEGGVVDMFTIVERMGNTTGYFIPRPTTCFVDECLCSFMCYQDDQLLSPSGGPCEIPLGVPENKKVGSPFVVPNPGNGLFQISWPGHREFELEVRDGLGRIVHRERFVEGGGNVELPHVKAGVYNLLVTAPDGTRASAKWIKQ